jgi:chitodextrinase
MSTRRRPHIATFVALLVTLAFGTQVSLAARSADPSLVLPQPINVVATDNSSVTISWPQLPERLGVVGYRVYVNGAEKATVEPDRGWRRKDIQQFTVGGLSCGTGYQISVEAFDRADNRSPRASTTVSTNACSDTAPPTAPTAVRQVAATESSVVLAWASSTDNVGVTEYGLYAAGVGVGSVSAPTATFSNLECDKAYLIGIDAADAASNRSTRVTSYFKTAPCPKVNKAPSTPTNVSVTGTTATSVSIAWSPSTDDVSVSGYGLYRSGTRVSETPSTKTTYTGLTCGITYDLGIDAFDGAGSRSAVVAISVPTSPCQAAPTSSGVVSQTIANGSTVSATVGWRGVYDKNGDKVEDDPGSIQFLVDGKQVLSEINPPFGDTDGFWDSTSVSDGPHTFQVRAVNDNGTLLATNTVTATVKNAVASVGPAQPASDTTAPTPPGNPRVVSATSTSATISWTAATDNVAVVGYRLMRGTALVGTTTATTATFNGLTCGTGYQVSVDAHDAAGNTSSAAKLSITTAACTDTQAPTAPGNVTASARTATSLALMWTASTDNVGVVGYGIYKGGVLIGTTAGTTGIVDGLDCGTNYTLAVDAFDASGNNSDEVVVMVATTACADVSAPTVPKGLTASASTSTGLTLDWTASTDDVGVTGYDVYRNGTKVGSSITPKYVASGLTCGTTYTFAVAAFDAAGNRSVQAQLASSTSACALATGGVHVWLSPSGSDNCSRDKPTAPCATLSKAYQVAQPSDVVEIAAGKYSGSATLAPDASKTSSSDVVFRPAAGASVTFEQQLVVTASHVTVDGSAGAGGTMSFTRGFKVDSMSSSSLTNDVTLSHLDATGEQSQVYSSNAVTISNVSMGGFCQAGAPGADALNIGESSGGVPTNLVIEDSDIGDICYFPPEHPDCVAIFGVDGLVFRRNRVFWCGTQGFYTKSDFGGRINNLLVENNWFGDLTRPGQSDAYYSVQINDGTNLVFRYNSIATGVDGSMNIDAPGPVSVYGNAGQLWGCPGGASYAYNVWSNAKCSSTDIQADPKFVNPTGGADFDLRLQAGSPAVGRGDPGRYPATDIEGQARTSPPDAGADQR